MSRLLSRDATEFNLPRIGPNLGCKAELPGSQIEKYPYRRDPSLFPVVNQLVFDQGDVAAMLGAHQDERPQGAS